MRQPFNHYATATRPPCNRRVTARLLLQQRHVNVDGVVEASDDREQLLVLKLGPVRLPQRGPRDRPHPAVPLDARLHLEELDRLLSQRPELAVHSERLGAKVAVQPLLNCEAVTRR